MDSTSPNSTLISTSLSGVHTEAVVIMASPPASAANVVGPTALSLLESALSSIGNITTPDSTDVQYHLAKACLMRFNHAGNKNDVFIAFGCYYNARVTPSLDPESLENAVKLYEKILSGTEISDEEQWKSLLELSNLILLQYHSTNDLMLLNKALSYMRKASRMRPFLSICLAAALLTVAQANPSEILDVHILDETLDVLNKVATEDRIALEAERAGNALRDKFERSGDLKDLNGCLAKLRQTVAHLSWRHPSRGYVLGTLGHMLTASSNCRSNLKDIEESIKIFEQGLELQRAPHPNFVPLLVNLALGLQTKFEQQTDIKDLERAIELIKEALDYCSDQETQSIIMNNLATAFKARSMEKNEPNDLDESIKLTRKTLSLRPVGHSDRGLALNNLAVVIQLRFNLKENFGDIEEVIQICQEALTLHPVSHPSRIRTLDHLGNGLQSRFEQRGIFKDLEEAIQFHQEAADLCGNKFEMTQRLGSPIFDSATDFSTALLNLSSVVQIRFLHQGDVKDLDKVVEVCRTVLDVCVPGNMREALENLAGGLHFRFERKGHVKDLEEAITLHRKALAQTPSGHYLCSTIVFNLARALCDKFEKKGNKDDLEEAIKLHEEALTLSPKSHPERKTSLTALANTMLIKLKHDRQARAPVKQEDKVKESTDLQRIIELQREALKFFPLSHAGRSDALNNLANALHAHFSWNGSSQEALEESICLYRQALELRPSPHSRRAGSLASWASALATRYKDTHNPDDLTASILHAQEASSYLSCIPVDRLCYTHNWGQIAAENNHDSALSAYREAINLLPQIAALHLDVVSRQSILSISGASQLASEAAACAIAKRDYSAAVELLEASRSVF
ncbi:hypothetical protein K438DRAFT_1751309 [Mycena galopus ATCC 62051]|nr:hypothetical protein K438DRAFT_1751309 [Mycena galopus ATCC 62051]